jgi:hypothetical protein
LRIEKFAKLRKRHMTSSLGGEWNERPVAR